MTGADSLPNAFAPLLTNDTRFGAVVHAIDQGPDDITVHFRDGVGTSMSVTADECVLTVPLVLLRHMEIGGLDIDKRFTIRNVYYGRAHKIFMQFSRKWWVEDYQITQGITVTDLAIRNVVYTPAGQVPGIDRGVIIASYAWEQDSIAYGMLSEAERISQALEDLCKIHPEARVDVRVRRLVRLDARPIRGRHRAALPATRDAQPVLRRHRAPGRSAVVRQRRLRPASASLDRGSHQRRGQERLRDQRRACATSCRSARPSRADVNESGVSVDLGSDQRDKVTLRFLDPSLEVAYQADTAEAARRLLTWACLVNAPIWFVGALLAPVVLGVDPTPVWVGVRDPDPHPAVRCDPCATTSAPPGHR